MKHLYYYNFYHFLWLETLIQTPSCGTRFLYYPNIYKLNGFFIDKLMIS